MRIEEFLQQPGAWLKKAPKSDIVVSSRVRLARNIRNQKFPDWASETEREAVWIQLRGLLEAMPGMDEPLSASMDELKKLDKQVLFERHLISREQAEKGKGSGLIVRQDESVAIMINEEDHLRLQAIRSGLEIKQAWELLNGIDDEIERSVHYAFSVNQGYLTACPSNIGTGMRASAMLHVPGLVLMEEINPIIKGMGKIGLAVRGLWGEGTEAAGNMFQVSNQITLGEKEEDIIDNLEQIVLELVEHEKNARKRLLEEKEVLFKDHVGRASGILSQAHILTSKEALDLLSGLRLGIDLGIVDDINEAAVNELLILTQPGHLQKIQGKKLRPNERDVARAQLVRERIHAAPRKTRSKTKSRNS